MKIANRTRLELVTAMTVHLSGYYQETGTRPTDLRKTLFPNRPHIPRMLLDRPYPEVVMGYWLKGVAPRSAAGQVGRIRRPDLGGDLDDCLEVDPDTAGALDEWWSSNGQGLDDEQASILGDALEGRVARRSGRIPRRDTPRRTFLVFARGQHARLSPLRRNGHRETRGLRPASARDARRLLERLRRLHAALSTKNGSLLGGGATRSSHARPTLGTTDSPSFEIDAGASGAILQCEGGVA